MNATAERPFISVVVITYNAARTLSACLASIFNIDYPHSRYEVLVVDGGSSDETRKIAAAYSRCKVIKSPNAGRALQRNLGVEAAKGELIAFTDADCTVERNWLALHASAHALGQEILSVGGPIEDGQHSAMSHATHISMFGELTQRSPPRDLYDIPTCNMSLKRNFSELVGLFDTRLDGIRHGSSEDTNLCWRIIKAGYRIVFDPRIKVWHYPRYDSANSTRSHLLKQVDMGRIHYRVLQLLPDFPGNLPTNPVLVGLTLWLIAAARAFRQILKVVKYGSARDLSPKVLACLVMQAPWWSIGYFKACVID